MLVSGGTLVSIKGLGWYANKGLHQEELLPSDVAGKDIDGPINILLLGMDQRTNSNDLIRTDSIIIIHISADHKQAYLISIPRDTRVDIPAFEPSGFRGEANKVTAAFAYGNQKDGKGDSTPEGRARGVALTARTISNLVPGGLTFNAVGLINYDGFKKLVEALGGVDMCVDERVTSEHYDAQFRYVGHTGGRNAYVYERGCRHFSPLQALDYVRQRDYLELNDSDYGRQRHQQQFLFAMFKKLLSKGTLTNPGKFGELRSAVGGLLTLDLNDIPLEDWIFTLKGLRPNDVTLVKTNGGKFNSVIINKIWYEELSPDSMALLQALHDDTVYDFLSTHTSWIARPS
jgi:LCP family protein required for cell wall assembly